MDDESFLTNRLWVGRLQATLDTLDRHLTNKLYVGGSETDARDTDVSSFGSVLTHNIGETIKLGYSGTYRLEDPGVSGVRPLLYRRHRGATSRASAAHRSDRPGPHPATRQVSPAKRAASISTRCFSATVRPRR
jgi:hypothetical protein